MATDDELTWQGATTAQPPGTFRRHEARRTVTALTILSHPDAAAVGRVAVLPRCGAVELSRIAPLFDGEPLRHKRVSRRPIRLTISGTGARLERDPGGMELVVDQTLVADAVDVPRAALDRGCVLILARTVALLLHRRPEPGGAPGSFGLVGDSGALLELRADIERLSGLDIPALIRGESGSGKELVAAALHRVSRRVGGPWITANMAAVPAATAASTLFGHARGAFTGAVSAHQGLFERAHGGTLFLDEIGATPPEVQDMMLRTLETGELQPLGASQGRIVDVRIIAATDADLDERAEAGTFRLPLLHRLAGHELVVPPLRERPDDVPRLIRHFLGVEREASGVAGPSALDPFTMRDLCLGYDWPGNVRELRNAVREMLVQSRGQPRLQLGKRLARRIAALSHDPAPPKKRSRRPSEVSESELLDALRHHGWLVKPTAEALGVSRSSLYGLIDRCPSIRKASDVPEPDLRACFERLSGDVDAMTRELEVSRRGILMRLKQLGLR